MTKAYKGEPVVIPEVHESRKIEVSAAWLSKKFDCSLGHITSKGGCAGMCCVTDHYWPPRSGNAGAGPCAWLGAKGCTMAWDDKPITCNLYPLVINSHNKLVLHHRAQFKTSVCKGACGKDALLIDSCEAGLVSIFGKEQFDRVRADVVAGKDSYFIASPEVVTAIERGAVWEKFNIIPEPMSKFASLFSEDERKK